MKTTRTIRTLGIVAASLLINTFFIVNSYTAIDDAFIESEQPTQGEAQTSASEDEPYMQLLRERGFLPDEEAGAPEATSPPYVEGEVLVKFKEGAEPTSILKEAGVEAQGVERVHSIKPAVAKFKKDYKLEKDSEGWYPFLGKTYKEISEIPDEDMFKEAYASMPEVEKGLYRSYKITLPERMDVRDAIIKLKDNPNVEYAQPNYKYQIDAVPLPDVSYIPNDLYVEDSNNVGFWRQDPWKQDYPQMSYPNMWGLQKIEAIEAWNMFPNPLDEPGRDIVVAVIDTGVFYKHPDLAGNIWSFAGEIAGNGIDDDGSGYADDIRGYDFSGDTAVDDPTVTPVIPDSDPLDKDGHGTHVAGTIAAVGNNNMGVVGVAPRARIMPVKIFPNGFSDIAAQAIRYAAFNGARVLNNSWGPRRRTPQDPVIEDAIDYAYDEKRCVIVFSAGNKNDDISYYSPANYSKVIAVAATTQNDEKCSFSNHGLGISVSAPGGGYDNELGHGDRDDNNILSTMSDTSDKAEMYPELKVSDGYWRLAGTSMACPHVSGLAALILSKDPTLSNTDVRNTILVSSDDVGPAGKDAIFGWGRINARRALSQSPVPIIKVTKVFPDSISIPSVNGQFSLALEITNEWRDALNVNVSASVNDDRLRIDHANVNFGNLANQETKSNAIDPFVVTVISEMVDVERIPFLFTITADGGYETRQTINILMIPGNIQNNPFVTIDGLNSPLHMNRAIGDLDGDGTNELVICGGTPYAGHIDRYNTFDLYIFNNDGTLRTDRPITISVPHNDISEAGMFPVISDIDGNGTKEIIITARLSTFLTSDDRRSRIYVYRADGTPYPGWESPVIIGPKETFIEGGPVVADIDKDGKKEIIVNVNRLTPDGSDWTDWVYTAQCYAFKYNGQPCGGSWPYTFTGSSEGDQISWTIPVVGNVDGDEFDEVVTASISGKIHIIGYDGSSKRVIDTNYGSSSVSRRPPFLALANLDNDPELEIIFNFGVRIYAFNNDGTSVPANWPASSDGNEKFKYLAVGDINGDSIAEIITITILDANVNKYKIYAFTPDGLRLEGYPKEVPAYGYDGRSIPILADINADRKNEIIYWTRDETLDNFSKVYAVDYEGNIVSGFPKVFMHYYSFVANCPNIADFNNDGRLCLVVNFSGKLEDPQSGGSIYIVPLADKALPLKKGWPMYQHDAEHTGAHSPNHAPTLTSIGNKTINKAELLEFVIQATDPDDDPLTYSASDLPQGAIFNSTTHVFTWTPTYEQGGTYEVTFAVLDGIDTASETITITVTSRPPTCVSVSASPVFVTDIATVVSATYADPDGYQDLENVELLVNSSVSSVNCISLRYDRLNNKMYLRSDDGSSWLGGFAPRSNNTIENSFAKLFYSSSRVDTIFPDKIRVVFRVRVKPNAAFTGQKNIYLYAKDTTGAESGWQQKGTVIIENRPTIVSLSPNSGTFRLNTQLPPFNSQFSDLDGCNDIYSTSLLISTGMHFQNALYARYNKVQNKLYLWNWGRFVGGFTPESNNVIETPYGKLYCAQTTVPPCEGTNLTVNWSISFKTPLLGTRKVYLSVSDRKGRQTGWVQVGNITIGNIEQPKVPVITAVRPYWGRAGTRITITGRNFLERDETSSKVTFSFWNYRKTATIISWKDNEIICYVPRMTYRYRWYKLWVSTRGVQSNYRWFYYY